MHQVKVEIGVNEARDQTIYHFKLDGQDFATMDSIGGQVPRIEFHDFAKTMRPNEALYVLNECMVEFDLLDTWSDVEFTIASDGMR